MALTDRLTAIGDAIRAKSGKTEKLSLAQMPVEIANIKTGAGLNFTVVGNPKPASPSQNTLWVDTDADITGWYFAPENPFIGLIAESADTGLGSVEDVQFESIRHSFSKINGGKAAVAHCTIAMPNDIGTQVLSGVMLLSKDKDACAIKEVCTTVISGHFVSTTTIEATNSITHNGETFYYAYSFLSPKVYENVNTYASYASYAELAEALLPTYFMDGAVWFKTDANSDLSFNALAENGIQVHPVAATHFTSGQILEKTAQVYRNGEWVELSAWNGVLYDAGNQYEDITGGWVKGEGTATATIDDTGMKLSTSSSSAARIHVETKNAVDMTKYKTLYLNATITSLTLGSGVTGVQCRLGYASASGQNMANASTKVAQSYTAKGDVTLQLDISSVNGEQYVVFGIGYYSVAVTVNKIWME